MPGWTMRIIRGRPRLFVALVVGLVTAVVLPAWLAPATRALVAWDIAVTVFLGLTAQMFLSERLSKMSRDAALQQEGEWTIFALTLAGTVASFVAIFGAFMGASSLPPAQKGLHVAMVAYTLLATWLMTHTTFSLRFAHEYYTRSGPGPDVDGGLDFPGGEPPDYLDFFYFAIVLGMTFQVSDVQITSRKFRRLATVHGLLSFLYNTVIVALAVNISASLL